jgi:hypothetical protein
MPKKKDEECCNEGWMKKKKMMMGVGLLILGLILYAKEIGMIPYAGSIWSLAMILGGIVLLIKAAIMCTR